MKTIAVVVLLAYCCTGCQTTRHLNHSTTDKDATTGTHIRDVAPTDLATYNVGPPTSDKQYTWRGKPRDWRWIGDGIRPLTAEDKKQMRMVLKVLAVWVVASAIMLSTQKTGKPQIQPDGGNRCSQWSINYGPGDSCIICCLN